jgi:hypothetical protein
MFENLKQTAQTAATVAGLAGASLGMARPAEGCLMRPGESAQSYLDLGATAEGKVGWLKQTNSLGQVGYASATIINPYFAVTAGHAAGTILQSGGSLQFGTGGNYFNNQGQTISIAEAISYPSYQGGVDTNNPDIVILKLATPLAGVSQVSYGTANPFDVVTSFGYGFAFFAGEPSVPRDGFRRGWNAPVKTGAPLFGSDQWYNYTQFGGGGAQPSLSMGKGSAVIQGGGV